MLFPHFLEHTLSSILQLYLKIKGANIIAILERVPNNRRDPHFPKKCRDCVLKDEVQKKKPLQ